MRNTEPTPPTSLPGGRGSHSPWSCCCCCCFKQTENVIPFTETQTLHHFFQFLFRMFIGDVFCFCFPVLFGLGCFPKQETAASGLSEQEAPHCSCYRCCWWCCSCFVIYTLRPQLQLSHTLDSLRASHRRQKVDCHFTSSYYGEERKFNWKPCCLMKTVLDSHQSTRRSFLDVGV